jgi:hypothetical protein
MIEGKKDNLTLFIDRTSLVGDVGVGISFKSKMSACCLSKLKGSCSCNCFPNGGEEACLCFSIFLAVRNVLCGSPLATKRSKVGDVECGFNNGYFTVSWNVKGTASSVRKSLGMALKCFNPYKLYTSYGNCVRECGGSTNRDYFNYAANEVLSSLKDNIHCGVVGNIRLERKNATTKKTEPAININDMLKILHNKVALESASGTKTKPPNSDCQHENLTEIKSCGVASYLLHNYISTKAKGVNPAICGNYVLLPIKSSRWDTMRTSLKKGVKDYAKQKFHPVNDQLGLILGYMMLSTGTVACPDIKSMIKSDLKSSGAESLLNGVI